MGLRCLTSSTDGHVFAGFHSGHLKCYSGLGRLVWKKACRLPEHCTGQTCSADLALTAAHACCHQPTVLHLRAKW